MAYTTADDNNIIQCHSGGSWMAKLEDSITIDQLAVTLYYANWSDSSKTMYQSMAELAKAQTPSGVMFLKVDIDEAKDISARMGIRTVPTLLFVQKGKEVERVNRLIDMDVLHQKILSNLAQQQPLPPTDRFF